MLTLTDNDYMSWGSLRRCYAHPHDQSLCVKVSDATLLAIKRQQREVAYYESLQDRNVSFQYIARYHGKVETNLGPGFVYERVHNESGEVAPSLTQLVKQRPDLHGMLFEELQRLADFLVENRVLFHDLLHKHILCALRTGSHGQEEVQMKIVDALGDPIAIRVLNYVKPLAESKIMRRWNRYLVEPLCRECGSSVDRNRVTMRKAA